MNKKNILDGLWILFYKYKGHFIFIFFLFFFCAPSIGQNCKYTITGRVTDLHDDHTIAGALLQLMPNKTFKLTDSLGFYYFENLCPGKYELIVSHPFCDTVQKKIQLRSHINLSFTLEHHIDELEEVIVSDSKQKNIPRSLVLKQLNEQQLTRYSSQDLASALKSLSGVSILKTGVGISKPMIHGMFGSRVGIINNGMRLRDQEWGADHAPTIDHNAFENIELIKGAGALRYGGDILGGAIVLSAPTIIPKDSVYGKLITTGVSNGRGGSFSGQINKISSNGNFFKGQASIKRFGDFETPHYVLSNTGLEGQNVSLQFGSTKITKGWDVRYSYFWNEIGILRASHIGNVSDLARGLESQIPLRINPFTYSIKSPKQKSSHHTLSLNAFQWFNQTMKGSINYNFQRNQRFEFDVRRGNRSSKPAVDLRLKGHEINTDLLWTPTNFWDFNVGLSGIAQDHFANPMTGVRRLIPDYLKYQAAGYATVTQKKRQDLNIEFGLRWDYIFWDAKKFYTKEFWEDRNYSHSFGGNNVEEFGNQILVNPKLDFTNWAFHFGITKQWQSQWESTLNIIQSQRSPNAAELFSDGLHHSLATIERGDLNLKQETARKILIETSFKGPKLRWSVNPHYAYILDYIYIKPFELEQTVRGAFPVWEYHATTAALWGVDAEFSLPVHKNLFFSATGSWLRGKDLDINDNLINIPAWNFYQMWEFKPEQWKRWQFVAEIDWVGQQIRFPNNDLTITVFEKGELVSKTLDLSSPPQAYQLVDFGVTFFLSKFTPNKNTISLVCSNLLNTNYRNYLDRMRFYADALGRSYQLQWMYKF